MKRILAALAIVLLTTSIASAAGRRYVVASPVFVGPAPMVANYWPVGPVYTYPAPYVVGRPMVVAPAPVMVGPPAMMVPAPVVVRPRFVPGQPVRNAIRATAW